VKGEFIGGCDIVREMYATGELREMLSTRGIETVAA
jgi:monothiol glutaredoxin